MAKQSRLAGFLGLERYQGAETTPEESPQAVQADSRPEANASAGQTAAAQKTDSSHRLSALPGSEQYSVAESHAGSQGETYHLRTNPPILNRKSTCRLIATMTVQKPSIWRQKNLPTDEQP